MKINLRPVTDRHPPAKGRQVRAFLCIRNEAQRLPFILSYYRQAGVAWFFVIDNCSTDGSTEFLRAQPDCTVFTTADSYAAANYGMDWVNALLEEHGIGHWRLFVDADEILVYPHVEDLDLPEFCDYLSGRDCDGIYAFMLDMYAAASVANTHYNPGEDFLDASPLFDTNYEFRNRLRRPGGSAPFPPLEVVGGPRLRRLYPEFLGKGRLQYAIPRGLTKLRNSRLGRALHVERWLKDTSSPPLLSKVPLTFGRTGFVYVSSHKTVPLRLSPVTGTLLHFKFFDDFHARVAAALAEGQHFDGGSEYARYAQALETDPTFSLKYEGSVPYVGSDDLVARGLLRNDPSYDVFWAERKERRHASAIPDRAEALAAIL